MWILFSILAAFIWAICNTIDKFVITKWVKQPFVPLIILGFFGLIAGIIVYFTKGIEQLSSFNIFLAFIAGVFYILCNYFYFKALQIEEVSRVVPLFYLAPLMISIFAAIFLNEIFTPLKYLGIVILVLGAILISTKEIKKIKFNKAFWWMIMSALALAINQLLTKKLLESADFWTIFFYIRIGVLIALIPIMFIYLPELIKNIKQQGIRVLYLISTNETINIFGILSITYAGAIGSITLVNALASVQQFFVLFIASIISVFKPNIFKEEINKSTIVLKIVALILMFIGAILIT